MADDFDPTGLLDRPLVAHLATARPRVRPIWFLYEQGWLWWLTGPWSTLADELAIDPRVSLVVDTCDLVTGDVRQVVAHGDAELLPLDVDRARRKLARYLGPDESAWDRTFRETLDGSDGARFARLQPDRLIARDLSYRPAVS